MQNNLTVGLVCLGCDKNRVDGEKLLGEISKKFKISNEIEECDVLVINTCAFLNSSRQEAIETVFDYAYLKESGRLKKIIMTGCLPQKFVDELFGELVEVDAFLGTYDQSLICQTIEKLFEKNERFNFVGCGEEVKNGRFLTTPPHLAYLKISDGCSNFCTYCLIPKIRGKFKSYPMEDLIEEAKSLGDIQELILVAQDTTKYGEDLYGKNMLVPLIKGLSALENVGSIRLLYCYPEKITDELIDELANNSKLIKYIDIPMQHADDRILKLMNRKGTFEGYLNLVNKLKNRVKDIAIRSTFITGFPTETQAEHERLIEFIKRAKIFNAGFFTYSKEPDTPAFKLGGQVHPKTKQKRQRELYAQQQLVASEILDSYVGKTIEVLCDGISYEKQAFYGRAYFSAPEVDGLVYFTSDEVVNQGEKYLVKIHSRQEFDLYGGVENNELT